MENSSTSNNIASKDIDRLIRNYGLGCCSEDNLTISGMKNEILELIEKNSVVIIRGPTGSGKTTRVPRYILDKCYETKVGCNIIVTQPRRIAATGIAQRFCDERNWTLPSIVGYQIGQDTCVTDDTRLTFCTTAILLNQIIKQKNLNCFTHIIIDEVHERDQETDFLLLVVKMLLRTNSQSVKVILMSATIDVDKFSRYFSFNMGGKSINAPIFDIEKPNSFKVRTFYLDEIYEIQTRRDTNPSIPDGMFADCKRLIESLDRNEGTFSSLNDISKWPTILIFLPGSYEIEELEKVLLSSNSDKWEVFILHSTTTTEERTNMFKKRCDKRQIILATNVAESSITVPNVKYIIDFCLMKLTITDPQTNFQHLQTSWASKANCQQRAGRTGRVMDGVVYRLVTKDFFQRYLPEESPPEIQRNPVTNIILKSKILDISKPEALLAEALNPPDIMNVKKSILLLKESGALVSVDNDPCDGELTDLGRVMAELTGDVWISRMIVLGYAFSVLPDALIMAAGLVARSCFITPYKKKFNAYKAKLLCAEGTESDIITFRNVYLEWKDKKTKWRAQDDVTGEEDWANDNFVEVRTLEEIEASIQEWQVKLRKLGIKEDPEKTYSIWTEEQKKLVLKTVIAGSFYPQYFVTKPRDGNERTRNMDFPEPTKTVTLNGFTRFHPAMLYAKHLRNTFAECLSSQSERISIAFDSMNRAFVQFNSDSCSLDNNSKNHIGQVSVSVYHAIKLGLLCRGIKIPVMCPSRAGQVAKMRGITNDPMCFRSHFVEPPMKSQCENEVDLKGPYSPLQLEATILMNSGAGMKVMIDYFSVNSVMLDVSIKYHEPRLLVAAHISTSKAKKTRVNQISTRNTTLMPKIPGLASLMALIFAPQAELRCDRQKIRNTGVLCGLGYDSAAKRSLFPEHDIFLPFNFEITNEDLRNINNLRNSMSMIISVAMNKKNDGYGPAEGISELRSAVKNGFLGIIEKKRDPVSNVSLLADKQWCQYDPSAFVSEPEDVNIQVFRRHRILKTKEEENAREMMVLHLKQIRELAEGSSIGNSLIRTECKLCNATLFGKLQLREHLFSTDHFSREVTFSSLSL